MYEEVKRRAPVGSAAEHYFYGSAAKKAAKGDKKARAYLFTRGNLKRSIYQFHNKKLSVKGKDVYSISWNHKKAPYGNFVEYGHSGYAASPFLRPAYDAVRAKAMRAVKTRMREEIKKAIK